MDEHGFLAIIYAKDAVIDRDNEFDGAIGIHGTLFHSSIAICGNY